MISADILEIVGPAFIAGLMIALTHAPLGIEVLKRGIIFIDLAIAQIAGLGMIAAHLLWEEQQGWQAQGLALLFALCAALFFRLTERVFKEAQEAVIGCSFIIAASLALLLLADHPHGGEEIQHLLSGQILFVTWKEILLHLPVYAGILLCWFLRPQLRESVWFYVLFALAITSSVQLVGVYVVFASLILPALAACRFTCKHIVAWGAGITSVSSGLLIASVIDAPAGPVIVLSYAIVAALFAFTRTFMKRDTKNMPACGHSPSQ